MLKLRDYQEQALEKAQAAYDKGAHGLFLCAPTGAGKTVVFTEFTRRQVYQGKKCVVVAHRQELIQQAGRTIATSGMWHGVIKAGDSTAPLAPVQVVSIDSMRTRKLPWEPDYIILDEAHLSKADRYANFLALYPNARLLLVSATPIRTDGSGFEDLAEELIVVSTIQELISHPEGPFLVPPKIYTASDIGDIDQHVKTTAGDYNKGQLEDYMSSTKLVGDIVKHYQDLASGRKGVVFCSGIAHSKKVAEQFRAAGIAAEHLDGFIADQERAGILERLKTGKTTIVCNAAVLCEGWDEPSISYVGLARPTKSLSLYIQMAGRGLRIYDSKQDCVINDHGGNVARHGHILQNRQWSLKGRKKREKEENTHKECPNCSFWHEKALKTCPQCGYGKPEPLVAVPTRREVVQVEGRLMEAPIDEATDDPILINYRQLLKFAKSRGMKPAWAFFRLQDKFPPDEVRRTISPRLSQQYVEKYYGNVRAGYGHGFGRKDGNI